MAVLLLAEHDNKTLAPATAKVLDAAAKFGGEVDILIAGENAQALPKQPSLPACAGAARRGPAAQGALPKGANLIVPLMQNYDVLLAPARHGQNAPRPRRCLTWRRSPTLSSEVARYLRAGLCGNALGRSRPATKVSLPCAPRPSPRPPRAGRLRSNHRRRGGPAIELEERDQRERAAGA
jgi:hypothetical protein